MVGTLQLPIRRHAALRQSRSPVWASVLEGHHALLTRPFQQDNGLIKDVHTLRLALRQVPCKVHRIPLVSPVKRWQLTGMLCRLVVCGWGRCCCGLWYLGCSFLL